MALDMSDRAADLASMLAPDATSPSDIVPIIHEEIDSARAWRPAVSFVLDATLDEWAYCSGLFEPVFRVSLRNAAKRSIAADAEPVVGVSVHTGPEAVTVSVSDRGPPLTDHERAVLCDGAEPRPADRDDMSRWLINWGVEQAGGTLRVGTDGAHTSIELTFPRTGAE
jgi:signal transduction histidine kinase